MSDIISVLLDEVDRLLHPDDGKKLRESIYEVRDEIDRLRAINADLLSVAKEAFNSMETFECDGRSQMPRLRRVIQRAAP